MSAELHLANPDRGGIPDLTAEARAFAGMNRTTAGSVDGSELARWFRRNKYPLMGLAYLTRHWLQGDLAFAEALLAEREWYDTQRREYGIAFDAWRREGIECLMIKSAGNYPSFPHTSDNIDILFRSEQAGAARDVLRRSGYVEVRNVEEPRKFLFRRFHGGRCVSAIHVHEQIAWFVGFLNDEEVWERKRPAADDPQVNVPSPEDAILINLAHACYENKVLRLNDVVRVRHALESAGRELDWVYIERTAEARGWPEGLAFMLLVYAWVADSLFGDALIPSAMRDRLEWRAAEYQPALRRLEAIRANTVLDLPLDLSYPFCKRLYYRKILADPKRSARERLRDVAVTLIWGIKLKSKVRPQAGMLVSVSGPDGSGKTEHARALVDALQLCELKAHYFWSRGGSTGLIGALHHLRARLRPGTSPPVAGDAISRRRTRLSNPLVRVAWSWAVAADQLTTYYLRAWLPSRLGRIVVCDRYAYDTAVEMDASLPPDARWSRMAISALTRLAPRPRLAYLLDVAPETARARKPDEPWHAHLDDERRSYLDLAQGYTLRVLSTEGSFARSNDPLIQETFAAYMADFETWANALFYANPSQKNPPDEIWARGVGPP
jgi:thymidylate kinase